MGRSAALPENHGGPCIDVNRVHQIGSDGQSTAQSCSCQRVYLFDIPDYSTAAVLCQTMPLRHTALEEMLVLPLPMANFMLLTSSKLALRASLSYNAVIWRLFPALSASL